MSPRSLGINSCQPLQWWLLLHHGLGKQETYHHITVLIRLQTCGHFKLILDNFQLIMDNTFMDILHSHYLYISEAIMASIHFSLVNPPSLVDTRPLDPTIYCAPEVPVFRRVVVTRVRAIPNAYCACETLSGDCIVCASFSTTSKHCLGLPTALDMIRRRVPNPNAAWLQRMSLIDTRPVDPRIYDPIPANFAISLAGMQVIKRPHFHTVSGALCTCQCFIGHCLQCSATATWRAIGNLTFKRTLPVLQYDSTIHASLASRYNNLPEKEPYNIHQPVQRIPSHPIRGSLTRGGIRSSLPRSIPKQSLQSTPHLLNQPNTDPIYID